MVRASDYRLRERGFECCSVVSSLGKVFSLPGFQYERVPGLLSTESLRALIAARLDASQQSRNIV